MDKRKLYEDIALIRRRIFALSAFMGFGVVAVVSILGRGFDFFSVFVNSALAMMVFGALGFVVGMLYERVVTDPLVESYRMEALEERTRQLGERLEMDLPVSDLRAGMKVCNQVNSGEGATLVRPGTILTDRLINMLREKGVESVRVKAQRAI